MPGKIMPRLESDSCHISSLVLGISSGIVHGKNSHAVLLAARNHRNIHYASSGVNQVQG